MKAVHGQTPMEKQRFEPAFPMIPPAPPHGVDEEHTIGSG